LDQAASSDPKVLWNIHECGSNPDLDINFGLCADGDNQEEIGVINKPLQNDTDFKRKCV